MVTEITRDQFKNKWKDRVSKQSWKHQKNKDNLWRNGKISQSIATKKSDGNFINTIFDEFFENANGKQSPGMSH